MNFQILPNWCKKLGALLFFVCLVLSGYDDFMDGFLGVNCNCSAADSLETDGERLFPREVTSALNILAMLGLFIYVISKEKVEDELIELLRLKAFQTSIFIFILLCFVLYMFDNELKFTPDYFLFLYMALYLLIFRFKKTGITS
ncbi:hypothetical protein [Maribacter sp. 2307ULW6-5]|uniref:hypothetical protein n=1 Tax=Maribacter sp. 2307ULW6-5 TaxID=3386275 RepID=UPI0039BD5370